MSCRRLLCLQTAGPEFYCPWCQQFTYWWKFGESGRQGSVVKIPGDEEKGLRMLCLKLCYNTVEKLAGCRRDFWKKRPSNQVSHQETFLCVILEVMNK
ncbi:hypothetical protein L3Q82_014037 [Scortum barcoo]|uniref:Uncharacterized protein n=1 Tax=Scortum barcoo TaxID=214431 RepID=A0ACB8VW24_9TELE|nr:hypothetical protein L3Q82_014037 [Scortum barcoo]